MRARATIAKRGGRRASHLCYDSRWIIAEDYLDLPHHIEITRSQPEDGDGGWVADILELDGCIAHGATPTELMDNIRRAMDAWISAELDDGHDIPLPNDENAPDGSGRMLLRVPRSLHGALLAEARREGVSLNQFAAGALAGAVGWRSKPGRTSRRAG